MLHALQVLSCMMQQPMSGQGISPASRRRDDAGNSIVTSRQTKVLGALHTLDLVLASPDLLL